MKGNTIVSVTYCNNTFTITLSNDSKYEFSVNNIDGEATIFKV